MARLFATKPLSLLLDEAHEEGEHTLKRSLGPVNLITLGIGAVIGAGIFVLTGQAAAHTRRAGHRAQLCPGGHHLRLCRAVLRRIRFHHPHRRLRLYLRIRDAGRVCGVDHRLGSGVWSMPLARRRWRRAGRVISSRCWSSFTSIYRRGWRGSPPRPGRCSTT